QYPADEGVDLSGVDLLKVDVQRVQANFARYGLLDDQVQFLPGWFRDTLHVAPIEQLAIMRLDGDLYESTMDALTALYPKLSPGGFVIVDDYGAFEPCRRAVDDYRAANGIDDEIVEVDWTGAYWRRAA
ncbi:MAG TPA: TylF/MycF/NovP-related O-methyltransferase, partial [Acidimicrobiia bacterium]|nr:TylF/MycF/NovP-related O-methyltransferase [Acidimicrobiia bacterium]